MEKMIGIFALLLVICCWLDFLIALPLEIGWLSLLFKAGGIISVIGLFFLVWRTK